MRAGEVGDAAVPSLQQPLVVLVKGESRGAQPPLARGLGDVPPVTKLTSEGGRVGPPNAAAPCNVHPLPLEEGWGKGL